jgi:hypothetical protein
VVAKCNTDTLFDDLFRHDDVKIGAVPSKKIPNDSQLLQFVDNYFKSHKLMSLHQLKKWRKERRELIEFQPESVEGWTHEDKRKREWKLIEIHYTNLKYKKMFRLAKEE